MTKALTMLNFTLTDFRHFKHKTHECQSVEKNKVDRLGGEPYSNKIHKKTQHVKNPFLNLTAPLVHSYRRQQLERKQKKLTELIVT
jgi:hypothetical protein